MAARLRKTQKDETWKYYVYQFFLDDVCVYVGKGSGFRFKTQEKRFNLYKGMIVAYFLTERDALTHEMMLIKMLKPQLNKALMPEKPEPWLYQVLPDKDTEFYAWCNALGTRQMAVRVMLSFNHNIIKYKYGVDIKHFLSKLDPWCEVFNGCRT